MSSYAARRQRAASRPPAHPRIPCTTPLHPHPPHPQPPHPPHTHQGLPALQVVGQRQRVVPGAQVRPAILLIRARLPLLGLLPLAFTLALALALQVALGPHRLVAAGSSSRQAEAINSSYRQLQAGSRQRTKQVVSQATFPG